MSRFPRPTGKRVVKALGKAGFQQIRQRGSHVFLQHSDGRATFVPVHAGETLGPGLANKILQDAEISREEFSRLLSE